MQESITSWLHSAGRYPLLSAQQEIILGNQVRAWLDSDQPTPQQVRAGRRAKEKMISCNLRLVSMVLKKYRNQLHRDRSLSEEDILQEGCLGLSRAADKFEPAKGYKFSTYAYWWVRQSMSRSLQSAGTIKRPTSATLLMMAYRNKGQISDAEFCEQRGITLEKLRQERQHYSRVQTSSLDKVLLDGDSNSTLGEMQSGDVDEAQQLFDQLDAQIRLKSCHEEAGDELALCELSMMHSTSELVKLLGLSRSRVSKKISASKIRLSQLVPAD